LFRLKEDIGGYGFREVMVLWGLSASSFGLSHVLFARVFSLPELIINGKLDAYLVLPKNVLLGVMTSSTRTSAIGDVAYGLIMICLSGFGIGAILLFLLFTVTGAVIITAFALLMGSLSFWFVRMEIFGNQMQNVLISFATYPDGIFKGGVKYLLYYIIPTGMMVYLPVHVITDFNPKSLLMVLGYALGLSVLAVGVFYRGLRRYSSGNLMEARL
jgi:ABC-2 type transport system permease protein